MKALEHLDIDPGVEKAMLTPNRSLTIELQVPMDNGDVGLFTVRYFRPRILF